MPAPPVMRTFMGSSCHPSAPRLVHQGLPQRDAAGLGPAEALEGGAARLVLAADPAVVAAGIYLGEQPAVVEVARVRLTAIGRVGDLVVAREGGVFLDRDGHVAILDLPVIDVELQAETWLAHLVDDGARLGELVEEVAWNVAAVDWFDHGGDASRCSLARGLLEVGDEDLAARALMHEAGHHMHELAAGCRAIGERGRDVGIEVPLAAGKRGTAALAPGRIACGCVDQRQLETMAR